MERQEFLNRYLVERHNTNSMKWDGQKARFDEDGLLGMWIADMEFSTCKEILSAMTERVRHGVFGYTVVPDSYYQAYSDWMERRYHFPVKKEWVRFSQSCITSIVWAIHAFTEKEDAVLTLTPVYYPFFSVVTNNERKLVTVDLDYDQGHFTMNYAAIEEAVKKNHVKMFLMCSPHNPSGRVWSEEELDQILSICRKYHVLVVSDEIHQDIVTGSHPFIPAAVVKQGKYRDIVITLNAASKTFNLATLLHSHIIITDENLMKKYDKIAAALNRTEISVLGMTAAEAGYRYGQEWLDGMLSVVKYNYEYLKQVFAEKCPRVTVCDMEGCYLMMLDLRDCVKPERLHDLIQKRCRLAVDYGEWFGDGFAGFIRLNLATDPELVKQAAESIIREVNLEVCCDAEEEH